MLTITYAFPVSFSFKKREKLIMENPSLKLVAVLWRPCRDRARMAGTKYF
jgi:hypothetical protein